MLCLLTLWSILRMGFGRLVCYTHSPRRSCTHKTSVTIINADNGTTVRTLSAPNVFELGFSPLGTYVITWQRPSKDEAGDAVKNLTVWRVVKEDADSYETNETVGKFVQKSQTGWNLQYTFDERFCARVVTNEVQIYESHDLTKVWNKLRVEGVSDFAISPGENHSIALFVPERKVGGYNNTLLLLISRLAGSAGLCKSLQCA